jgi:hypothetical protein
MPTLEYTLQQFASPKTDDNSLIVFGFMNLFIEFYSQCISEIKSKLPHEIKSKVPLEINPKHTMEINSIILVNHNK